jgi:hypothetical protein
MPTTRRPRPAGLLGIYPVPELHLVGAPIADNPPSPIQWQSTAPPLQYGIDYTFMHREGREPVRWRESVITVRITGPAASDRHAALAAAVAELRVLTKLNLVTGDPAPISLAPPAIPDGEIHVRYLAAVKLADLHGRTGGHAGLGGALRCTAGCCYVTGYAIINADLAGPDATTGHALAILRHELAHALGLGHAARPTLLMHHQIAASTTSYGRGDQHGLALLGPRLLSGRPHKDTAMLGTTPHMQDLRPVPRQHEIPAHSLAWCSAVPVLGTESRRLSPWPLRRCMRTSSARRAHLI